MHAVRIRFYAELNDYLPTDRRQRDIVARFPVRRSVKDLVESFGVPHTEADLVLVNGEPVDWGVNVGGGDRVSVYPMFESIPVGSVTRVRQAPLREPRFVCDVHLRKLARILRWLGFDAERAEQGGPVLVERARKGRRTILTGDRYVLMRNDVDRGLLVTQPDPWEQARRVVARLGLQAEARPFTRCPECNGMLETIEADHPGFEACQREAPPRVRQAQKRYARCRACGKLYWEGTHHERLREKLAALLEGGEG